ncbi:MAG: hypothetical protein ABUS48_02120 [Pseudomonadota bacterium]
MATARTNRRLLGLLCSAAVVGVVGYGFALKPAAAQEASPPSNVQPVASAPADMPPAPVNFADPSERLARGQSVGVSVHEAPQARFLPSAHDAAPPDTAANAQGYEVKLTADGDSVGVPVDLSFAHRGNFNVDQSGDLDRRGVGSEVRVGQGFANQHGVAHRGPTPGWYAFAASDNQALTWNPGTHNAFGDHGSSFGLQDRVEIGDHQAGVTYETGSGVQASLAYVERDVSAHVGNRSYSHDENFTGVTVTMRH